MNKMMKFLGRGKWLLALTALTGCGGASQPENLQAIGFDSGGAVSAHAGAMSIQAEAGAAAVVLAGSTAGGAGGSAGNSGLSGAGATQIDPGAGNSAGGTSAGSGGNAAGSGGTGQAGASTVAGASSGGGGGTQSASVAGAGQAGAAQGGASGGASQAGSGGQACQCSTGACCDGCQARPSTYSCGTQLVHSATCAGNPQTSTFVSLEYGDLFCDGAGTGACSRWVIGETQTAHCPPNQICLTDTHGQGACYPE